MGQFFGIAFVVYIFGAGAVLPIVAIHMALEARDCRTLSQEDCVWVVVPKSQAAEALAKDSTL